MLAALAAASVLTLASPVFAASEDGALGIALTSAVNGSPVPLAAIIVTSADGRRNVVQTDRDGIAAVSGLAPGTYDIAVLVPHHLGDLHLHANVVADSVTILRERAGIIPLPTLDVYSVTADGHQRAQALGGDDGMSAYADIASVPGAYVPPGQSGWAQSMFLRGADYMQLGYEIDGVPVNRSFDNFTAATMSALGVSAVRVYPGAAPIDAQAHGLGGEVDLQIESGTDGR